MTPAGAAQPRGFIVVNEHDSKIWPMAVAGYDNPAVIANIYRASVLYGPAAAMCAQWLSTESPSEKDDK